MKIIDISFNNLWNLNRPHFELLAWDVHSYFSQDEDSGQLNGYYTSIEIIFCSFKFLLTIDHEK